MPLHRVSRVHCFSSTVWTTAIRRPLAGAWVTRTSEWISLAGACCPRVALSGVAYLPHPSPSPVYFHQSMLLFSLFWVLYFEVLSIFYVFFWVPFAVCNYLSCMIWGGLWNLHCFVLLLESFGCVFVDIPSLTVFIGSQFSWFLHKKSIDPCHLFDALSLLFFVY